MAITINGSGTITGISTGGLPDGIVDDGTLATSAVTSIKIADGAIINADIKSDAAITASKLESTLNLSGKTVTLPAASVTAHVTQTDTTAIENNIAMLGFYRAADNSKAVFNMVDSVVDTFTDATGIDAGNSTNENLTSGYYSGGSASGSDSTVSSGFGSSFTFPNSRFSFSGQTYTAVNAEPDGGAFTSLSVVAANQDFDFTARLNNVTQGTFSSGNNWWLGVANAFGSAGAYSMFNNSYDSFAVGHTHGDLPHYTYHNSSGTLSTVGTPLGNSSYDWEQYDIFTISRRAGVITCKTIGNGSVDPYVYTYPTTYTGSMKLGFGATGNWGYVMDQVSYTTYAIITVDDLTLQSTATTAETTPTTGDIVMLLEDAVGTATLNTDIKGYVSRDGGTTWTQGTLTDEGGWGTNKKVLAFHNLDISAQPSGTSMKYKVTTHNQSVSKETRVHATSLAWA
jgi:hypothetical protein